MAIQKTCKFKMNPKYPHHRSEGMTHRRNGGSKLQPKLVKRHHSCTGEVDEAWEFPVMFIEET